MALDLRTVLVVGMASSVIVGCLHLAIFATGRFGRWSLWWGLGNLLIGLGALGVAVRGLIPDMLSISAANLASWIGCLLLLVAIRSFAGRKQTVAIPVASTIVVAVLMTSWQGPDDFARRVVLMALCCAASDLVIASEALRLNHRRRLATSLVMAGLFAVTAGMFLTRAAVAASGWLGDTLFGITSPAMGWLASIGAGLVILRSMSLLLVAAEHSHDMLIVQAAQDPLTGAMNRGGLAGWLERFAKRPAADRQRIGVLLIDIDDFKLINDGHGHAAGDMILRLLAEVALDSLRPTDVLARHGGDEFIVILPELRAAEATRVAERLRARFNLAAAGLHELSRHPTISIGVADGDLRQESFESILARADEALYRSKRDGRDRVQMHSLSPLSASL